MPRAAAKTADSPKMSSASCRRERILAGPFGAREISRLARDKTTSRAGVSRLSDGTSSIRAASLKTGFVTSRSCPLLSCENLRFSVFCPRYAMVIMRGEFMGYRDSPLWAYFDGCHENPTGRRPSVGLIAVRIRSKNRSPATLRHHILDHREGHAGQRQPRRSRKEPKVAHRQPGEEVSRCLLRSTRSVSKNRARDHRHARDL
jgi:hypothetical protein